MAVRLLALRTGRALLPRNIIFLVVVKELCYKLEDRDFETQ
jgi:hypothetical protein